MSDLSKTVKKHEIYVSPAAERVLKELASKALLQHRTQELFFPLPRRPSSSAGLLIPNKNAAGVQATQSVLFPSEVDERTLGQMKRNVCYLKPLLGQSKVKSKELTEAFVAPMFPGSNTLIKTWNGSVSTNMLIDSLTLSQEGELSVNLRAVQIGASAGVNAFEKHVLGPSGAEISMTQTFVFPFSCYTGIFGAVEEGFALSQAPDGKVFVLTNIRRGTAGSERTWASVVHGVTLLSENFTVLLFNSVQTFASVFTPALMFERELSVVIERAVDERKVIEVNEETIEKLNENVPNAGQHWSSVMQALSHAQAHPTNENIMNLQSQYVEFGNCLLRRVGRAFKPSQFVSVPVVPEPTAEATQKRMKVALPKAEEEEEEALDVSSCESGDDGASGDDGGEDIVSVHDADEVPTRGEDSCIPALRLQADEEEHSNGCLQLFKELQSYLKASDMITRGNSGIKFAKNMVVGPLRGRKRTQRFLDMVWETVLLTSTCYKGDICAASLNALGIDDESGSKKRSRKFVAFTQFNSTLKLGLAVLPEELRACILRTGVRLLSELNPVNEHAAPAEHTMQEVSNILPSESSAQNASEELTEEALRVLENSSGGGDNDFFSETSEDEEHEDTMEDHTNASEAKTDVNINIRSETAVATVPELKPSSEESTSQGENITVGTASSCDALSITASETDFDKEKLFLD